MPSSVFDLSPRYAWASHQGLTVWLLEPAIMLTEADDGTRFTTEHATFLAGPASDALIEMLLKSSARASFFHDFRGIRSYESEARVTFAGWPLRFGKERVEMVHVLLDPAAPPLVRMAASAAEMAITAAGFSHRTYWSPAELEAALPPDIRSKNVSAVLRSGARARLTLPARGSAP